MKSKLKTQVINKISKKILPRFNQGVYQILHLNHQRRQFLRRIMINQVVKVDQLLRIVMNT